MTALVNYRKTGRLALAGWSWYNFAKNVQDRSIVGTVSWGTVALESTIAVFYPDPIATAVGYGVTRSAQFGKSAWWRAVNWFWNLPAAKRSIYSYLAILPFAIAHEQWRKEETLEVGFTEGLGEAMWQAQTVPDTERLLLPQSINPMTGSRVF